MSSHTESPGGPAEGAAPVESLTRRQKFRLIVKVVELRLRFIALMAATGLAFAYWDTLWNYYEKWTRPPGERHIVASDVEYYCPMHPTVVQSEPGSCPICGMPLSKRKKGQQETLPPGVTARLALSPDRVEQAGIGTVDVAYRPLSETVITVGSVTFDERRLARISSKAKGMSRVERLFINFTGTPIEAGAPLAEIYSPELNQAIRELLLAQQSAQERPRLKTPLAREILGGGDLAALARQKLSLWGITPRQVDEIVARGAADFRVPILSPISGVVVRKNVVEGQYVSEGEALFEVADLRHVWIQAQVYEDQVGLIEVGQSVEATVEAYPGEVFQGTVAFKDPALNPATRTLNVRYDLANPDFRLRPGMSATVTVKAPIAKLPAFRDQLARSGGVRAQHAHAIARTPEEQKVCPVTKLKLGSMGAPVAVEVGETTVWTCCEACSPRLKAEPEKYLARLATAPTDEVLAVPESAVVDTGMKKVVFVESEPGVFEGREVILGPLSGDLYPVLEGLLPGERVASAGSFLLDAETRLKASSAPTPARSSDDPRPVPFAAREAAGASGHRH